MRKLIRDKGANRFLQQNGEWTEETSSACDFMCKDDEVSRLESACNRKAVEWFYVFDYPGTTAFDFALEKG